jgi:hypothetical protein
LSTSRPASDHHQSIFVESIVWLPLEAQTKIKPLLLRKCRTFTEPFNLNFSVLQACNANGWTELPPFSGRSAAAFWLPTPPTRGQSFAPPGRLSTSEDVSAGAAKQPKDYCRDHQRYSHSEQRFAVHGFVLQGRDERTWESQGK